MKNTLTITEERQPLFLEADQIVKDTIAERNRDGKLTFFNPALPIRMEASKLAYLFDTMLTKNHQSDIFYRTFFGNSFLEALHGAIKVSRHQKIKTAKKTKGRILCYDRSDILQMFFDPINSGPEKALVPNVEFYTTEEVLRQRMTTTPHVAVIFRLTIEDTANSITEIYHCTRSSDSLFILDASQLDTSAINLFLSTLQHQPDIFIWGEPMTRAQVPFGAFSMTQAVFKPWESFQGGMIHSSTYGGNGLAVQMVLDELIKSQTLANHDNNVLEAIDQDEETLRHAFARHINPVTFEIFRSSKLNANVFHAKGSQLKVGQSNQQYTLIDCLNGAGCSLRGHNPNDIIEHVLAHHSANHSYWKELEQLLGELTGLKYAFPGVSGATAVDTAISLALLARKDKRRIICFNGNYAGRTLISLNGSTGMPIRPFLPLYADVEFINPKGKNASAELEKQLDSGTVALVWFEMIQGQHTLSIDNKLIQLIQKKQREHDYLIGIDEVLTGCFRTGEFLYHTQLGIKADLVTLSKAISDMTFPISATVCTDEVKRKASQANQNWVTTMESMYLNELGSHISLHALKKAMDDDIQVHVIQVSSQLKEGLTQLAQKTSFIKKIEGEGLFLHMAVNDNKFPVNYIGSNWMDSLLSRLIFLKGGALIYYNRYLPALNISREEVDKVIQATRIALQTNKFLMLMMAYQQMFKTIFSVKKMIRKSKKKLKVSP